MVWCTCPIRHPRTGQNKDRVQVSFIRHSFPEARCLGFKVFLVSILENVYDNKPSHSLDVNCFARRLQRYYLLVPYKENICYLHYKACVEWDGDSGPSKNQIRKRAKDKIGAFLMGTLQFPCLLIEIKKSKVG